MNRVFFLLLGWLVVACRQPESVPDDLVPEEKMVGFLSDLHVAEQRVNDLRLLAQDSSLAVFQRIEADLYRKHRIDTAAYRRSYAYYAARPELFRRIYQGVVDSLTHAEEASRRRDQPPGTRPDSTARPR